MLIPSPNEPIIKALNPQVKLVIISNSSSLDSHFQVWSTCGSLSESDDEHGFAHLLEHMFFRSQTVRESSIIQKLEGIGGGYSAYTSYDRLVLNFSMQESEFYSNLADFLKLVFTAKWDEPSLELEKKVILEEFRDQENEAKILEEQCILQDIATEFELPDAYGRNILGTKKQIENFEIERLKKFYEKKFLMMPITLVISTGIKPRKIEEKIRYFLNTQTEILALSFKDYQSTHTNYASKESTFYSISSKWAPERSDHILDVSDVLTKLEVELFSRWLNMLDNPFKNVFSDIDAAVLAVPICFRSFLALRFIVKSPVERDCQEWTAKILDYLKQALHPSHRNSFNALKDAIFLEYSIACESEEHIASLVGEGSLEPDGIYKALCVEERVSHISLATIFTKMGTLLGKPSELKREASSVGDDIFEYEAKNYDLLGVNKTGSKITQVFWVYKGGLCLETIETNGISFLLEQCLNLEAFQKWIVEKVDSSLFGRIKLEPVFGKDSFGISCIGPSSQYLQILSIVKHAWDQIQDTKDLLDALKQVALTEMGQLVLEPGAHRELDLAVFFRKTFPDGHPYGLKFEGEEAFIERLSYGEIEVYLNDLKKFKPVISIVGEFERKSVTNYLENLSFFELCENGQRYSDSSWRHTNHQQQITQVRTGGTSDLILGTRCFSAQNTKSLTQGILLEYFRGSSSFLSSELRINRGLVYDVDISTRVGQFGGAFALGISCKNKNLDEVRSITLDQLNGFDAYLRGSEIDNLKTKHINRWKHRLLATRSLGIDLALNKLYGIGLKEFTGYIDKVHEIEVDDVLELWESIAPVDQWTEMIVHGTE